MIFLEIVGTIAFSVSGAIEAMKKNMDMLGVMVLGLVTAVGGGVLRDIVIGELPPAVFQNTQMVLIALASSLFAFLAGIIFSKPHREVPVKIWNVVLLISDAIGLGTFTVLGIQHVQILRGYAHPLLLLFVGVITGVGGGIMRDLFAGNIPYIFRKYVYATASIAGAVIYLGIQKTGHVKLAAIVSVLSVLCLRLLAAKFKWNLPRVKIE